MARQGDPLLPSTPHFSGLTDLPIGHANEPVVHKIVSFGVPGKPLHDVTLRCLISQGDCRDLEGAGWERQVQVHRDSLALSPLVTHFSLF